MVNSAVIVKTYRCAEDAASPKSAPGAQFTRLRAVLETLRCALPGTFVSVAAPQEECEALAANVPLGPNAEYVPLEELSRCAAAQGNGSVLVLDEQALYATQTLVNNVLARAAGGGCAGWEDVERLFWGFNYHDSCQLFACPAELLRRHGGVAASGAFSTLQQAVFADLSPSLHSIGGEDLGAAYGRFLQFNPLPYHYYIEPTSRCNSKCVMCPFHSPEEHIAKGRLYIGDKGEDMPLELFQRLVDEIAGITWNYLPYYRHPMVTAQLRGEPLLAPNIREMLSAVKANGIRLSFSTNGSILHKDAMAEFLVDIGTDEIVVSIDGDADEYARIRPQLNYGQVVENIKLLDRLRAERGSAAPALHTKRVRLSSSTDAADRQYLEAFTPLVDSCGICNENFDDFKTQSKGFLSLFYDLPETKRLPCLLLADVCVVKSSGMVDMCFGAAEHYIGDTRQAPLLTILQEAEMRREVLASHASGQFACNAFCSVCSSWKAQYSKQYPDGPYDVSMNPIMAYWRLRKDVPTAPAALAPQQKEGLLRRLKRKLLF